MSRVRVEVFVSGRVQGVYYRAFTEKEANLLGIGGYVRNLTDGRVHLEAEGDRSVVDQLIRRLWEGPPRAKVSDVQVTWRTVEGGPVYSSFEIRDR
jgi:acylphosphatase